MTVTNKRVFVKVGLAARRTIELLLSRVESIGVEESVMGRMLGYGTVIVRGTGGTPEVFNIISHPLEFRTQVQQQIEKSPGNSRLSRSVRPSQETSFELFPQCNGDVFYFSLYAEFLRNSYHFSFLLELQPRPIATIYLGKPLCVSIWDERGDSA